MICDQQAADTHTVQWPSSGCMASLSTGRHQSVSLSVSQSVAS